MDIKKMFLHSLTILGVYFLVKTFILKPAMVSSLPVATAGEVALQINRSVRLPAKIDEDVTLQSVSAQGNNLVFKYALVTYTESSLEPELVSWLNEADEEDICRIMDGLKQKINIDPGIRFTREYLNSSGSSIHSIQVSAAACA